MVYKQSATDVEGHVIVVSGASKCLNGTKIINDVSFHVPYNSIYAIIGPNGAGKTTLLRLMMGLLNLDKGKIIYTFNEQEISVLLENDYLFEAKTGWENLRDFGVYLDVEFSQVSSVAMKYAELLQLISALDRKVATYSKGMKRKLSLLITLLKNAPILMLDELTSGVDPESRKIMRSVLHLLKEERKTIIITSHDLAEVQKISDWITILANGSIAEVINNHIFEGDLEKKFFNILEEVQ